MITPEYCRVMARYNRWQNGSLYAAAEALDGAARQADRGAHFGSIEATLNHLLWADHVWMSRLDGWTKPQVGIPGSVSFTADWEELRSKRRITDARITRWAEALAPGDLDGPLVWNSGALGRDVQKPLALCVMHLFNHQTHHRGQVHAMLTAAGAKPDDTDLFMVDDR